MRKVLPVLMALAMTAAALTGCAKGAGETAAEATTAAAAEASTETSAEETAEAPETESETETESTGTSAAAGYTLRIGSLKGPTSMGLVELMDQAAKGEAKGSYEFTMVTAADELLGKIVSG
ncbi:MAG: ABC transporter substrate-binding protein, partial [Hungatella hathewayi]|nr:ABC transporter substrate-binding protein [Hungatella hathewayi]